MSRLLYATLIHGITNHYKPCQLEPEMNYATTVSYKLIWVRSKIITRPSLQPKAAALLQNAFPRIFAVSTGSQSKGTWPLLLGTMPWMEYRLEGSFVTSRDMNSTSFEPSTSLSRCPRVVSDDIEASRGERDKE